MCVCVAVTVEGFQMFGSLTFVSAYGGRWVRRLPTPQRMRYSDCGKSATDGHQSSVADVVTYGPPRSVSVSVSLSTVPRFSSILYRLLDIKRSGHAAGDRYIDLRLWLTADAVAI